MKRPIDISKKSNKKCEHCENWTGWETMQCKLNGEKKKLLEPLPGIQLEKGAGLH